MWISRFCNVSCYKCRMLGWLLTAHLYSRKPARCIVVERHIPSRTSATTIPPLSTALGSQSFGVGVARKSVFWVLPREGRHAHVLPIHCRVAASFANYLVDIRGPPTMASLRVWWRGEMYYLCTFNLCVWVPDPDV